MITYGRFGLLGVRAGSVLCWGDPAEGTAQARWSRGRCSHRVWSRPARRAY